MRKFSLFGLLTLVSVLGFAHQHPVMMAMPKAANIQVIVLSDKKITAKQHEVTIRLMNTDTKRPVLLTDLMTIHTKKLHGLINDTTLVDYSHVHPKSLKKTGDYVFLWSPKTADAYRLWIDITPKSTGQQQFVSTILAKGMAAPIEKQLTQHYVSEKYQFDLSFDSTPIKVNEANMGRVRVMTTAGKPVKTLQPIMGAFAHIVGFYQDGESIVHIHPMGEEPHKDSARGGPELMFHLKPVKSGYIKLFVQVSINNQSFYIPFGINVVS